MTSKIKVDNINKVSNDSNIINKCGTTITLGASGDNIALASGATQTGFGRTGTVNWITTKTTTAFTAVSGEGYFCDTAASGAFTLTLPSSPSAGNIVGFKDYNGNFASANLTIGRNGSPINGGNSIDPVISTAGASIFLVYVDGTQGWVATQDDESVFAGSSFISATGGTKTTSGNDTIHTFTGPGTFTVNSASVCAANNVISYMIVGGGGSAAGYYGGGGAGGFREFKSPATPYTASPLVGATPITVSASPGSYPIVVGAGGAGVAGGTTNGNPGNNSSAFGITAALGGHGSGETTASNPAGPGGSGGGEGYLANAKGNGNTPPVSPPQGNNGGEACPVGGGGGGGGGATAVGATSASSTPSSCQAVGGAGGAGPSTSINGTPTAYAGGGGGGAVCAGGAGGAGGGGTGQTNPATSPAQAGTANTGGGGGARGSLGAGGSGIVIIRYKTS